MSRGEIWHDVCVTCRPEMDLAICGTKIEPNHQTSEDGDISEEDGQNCVVCMSMECPTCPDLEENQIVGKTAS